MKITKKQIKSLQGISWPKFIYWNYMSKKVIRKGKGKIIPYKGAVINVGSHSQIILEDGCIYINSNKPTGSRSEAFVLLRDNAKLVVHNYMYLNYKSTMEIHDGGVIEIGSAYFNSDCCILAEKLIKFGNGDYFAREVYIYDSDHHDFLNESGEKINPPKDVIIGDHVWVGLKSLLLRGSKIGDGAMVAACSVVGGKIKAGTMAQGNPARVYANIIWKI